MTEHIRLLDELGAEFARVLADAERASRKPRLLRAGARPRTLPIALAIVAALAGTAYALPATRAVVDGIAGPFAAWVAGGDDGAPGRPVEDGDSTPLWFRGTGGADIRLIAQTEGVGLYVQRTRSDQGPMLRFSLGQGLDVTATLARWREKLDQHTIFVLGNSLFGNGQGVLDDRGRVPLFGLTTRDVARVELHYADGPPLVARAGDGGFVLLVDAWRRMRDIVAYDATGHVLGRADVSKRDLRYLCEKEPGCPTASPMPARASRAQAHPSREGRSHTKGGSECAGPGRRCRDAAHSQTRRRTRGGHTSSRRRPRLWHRGQGRRVRRHARSSTREASRSASAAGRQTS